MRIILALLLLAPLMGCTSQTEPALPTEVHLSRDVVVPVPAFQPAGRPREITQLIVAHYGDRSFVFEAHISITAERLLMVGLDPLGRKAMTITWNAHGITYDTASWIPFELHPENILADMVLLYWPEKTVRPWLANGGATLSSSQQQRSVSKDGTTIITAHYQGTSRHAWPARTSYENSAWGYTLDIQSSEQK